MEIPDVVGYSLGEAKEILTASGVEITKTAVTVPPRNKLIDFDDNFRVIRVKSCDDKKVELLVCKPL